LQAKDTGVLEFVPHNYINKFTHPAWPYHGVSRYEPEDGDILIFPSYLLHRVERNTGNKQRITMAFDLSFAEK
jgi:ectoine hydroxylase-related dioxygenase (phytanoyl-CoA dioxygenase family)